MCVSVCVCSQGIVHSSANVYSFACAVVLLFDSWQHHATVDSVYTIYVKLKLRSKQQTVGKGVGNQEPTDFVRKLMRG